MEFIAIIGVGVTLAGLILNGQRAQQKEIKTVQDKMTRHQDETRSEFKTVREEISGLRERMAHVQGLLEGLLREAFIGTRAAPAEAVAEDAGQYEKR